MSSEILIENLEPIYGKTSHGREKVWNARILSNKEGYGIYEIEHGQEGGKLQLTRRIITEGKNLNKKNETTPLEQCKNEIRKKWNDKQTKEGYYIRNITPNIITPNIITPNIITQPIYPMLAKTYNCDKNKKNDIVFPCFVQPKLDGLRCLIYMKPASANSPSKIITQSRTGGYFEHLQHIIEEITPIIILYPNIVFDGELYTKEIPFENLAGLIKKKKMGEDDLRDILKVKYHIYDFIDLNNLKLPYKERDIFLNNLYQTFILNNIEFVETYLVHTKDQFYKKFQDFIENGYEGAMLRNEMGLYKQKYRSSDLQKYKEFFEDEYKIIGFYEGSGRDEGTVIWECITSDEKMFHVRPKGSLEYRRTLFENANNYIGKQLTVIFQELTEQGIPRFPIGKSIREDY